MNEKIIIKKCEEADIERTGRFYDDVVRWLYAHINYPRWRYGIYPSESSVREFVQSGTQYICESDGNILGAFALNTESPEGYRNGKWSRELSDGEYMVIHALAIDPKAQRNGTASELIRYCIDKAKSECYKAIRVEIVPTNEPAKRLFEKNGFTYAGEADMEIKGIPYFSLYELILIFDQK